MRMIVIGLTVVVLVFGAFGALLAADPASAGSGVKATNESVKFFAFTVMAASLGVAIAAVGCGIGQGIATAKAAEGWQGSRRPAEGYRHC